MRACLVTEWILALLATKQAHPESVTLDEVGPLMGLLYAFPRDERVQSAGAEALALIAMDEGDSATVSAEDLVEEGAITVLKEAMRNHRKNMHLQEQAGSALLHMASRSADVAIEIQQAGGTKAIAAAIKLHPVRAMRGRCAPNGQALTARASPPRSNCAICRHTWTSCCRSRTGGSMDALPRCWCMRARCGVHSRADSLGLMSPLSFPPQHLFSFRSYPPQACSACSVARLAPRVGRDGAGEAVAGDLRA